MSLARNFAKFRSVANISAPDVGPPGGTGGEIVPDAIKGGLRITGTVAFVPSNGTPPLVGNTVSDFVYWDNNGLYWWDGADWNEVDT